MAKDELIRERMFEHIKAWQASDLSQKEWCRQHEVIYHVFHYWYKRFLDQQADPSPDHSFVRLSVNAVEKAECEIVFADGSKVIFHKPVSASYLKGVLF